MIADHLAGHPRSGVTDAIVWEIRLPRVLLAAVVEAALTRAGTVMQVLVRNSLADPFLLGVSSGASVGATAVLRRGRPGHRAPRDRDPAPGGVRPSGGRLVAGERDRDPVSA